MHVFDSQARYDLFASLDHHTSTITSLQFNEYAIQDDVRLSGSPNFVRQVELISSSADRNLISKKIDLEKFKAYVNSTVEAAD